MARVKNGKPQEEQNGKSPKELQEEISYLKQQCNSLALRGHYQQCAKLIEQNMGDLYHFDRWPENFFKVLRTYQRCYPALNLSESLEEHLTGLFHKLNIPIVVEKFLKGGQEPAVWTAEHFKTLSMECRLAKDYDTALAYSELAVKIDPLSSGLALLRGWILDDLGRGEDALDAYQRALSLSKSNHQASESIARHYLKSNPKKALEYMEQAVEAAPKEANLHGVLGGIHAQMGNTKDALASFEQAVTLDPQNPDYQYQKGELLLEAGNENAAVTQFRLAVALDPAHTGALFRLACLYAQSQPATALEYVNTVVSREPEHLSAALLRGALLKKSGDVQGAIHQYKQVLAKEPNNHIALGGLGDCYLTTDPAQAVPCYKQASYAAPEVLAYHMGRARAHQRLGQVEEAIAAYKAVIGLDSKNVKTYAQLGALHREKNPEMAVDYYDKAIALDSSNSFYHAQKAEIMLETGQVQAAVESLDAACALDPGNAKLRLAAGQMMRKNGIRASALSHYQAAVNLDPHLDEAFSGMAAIYESTEPDKAYLLMGKTLHLDPNNSQYYYLKSQILIRLAENNYAAEKLLATGLDVEEIPQIELERKSMFNRDFLELALLYLNRATEMSPQNNTYQCARGNLLYLLGNRSGALEQYKNLLKQDPQNHEALYGFGRILAGKKDPKALEFLDRAIKLSPETARYHAEKAACLAQDPDRYREALECFDTAIALDTHAWEPVLEKATLLEQHGDIPPALEAYRRVLLINPQCLPACERLAVFLAERNPLAALHYAERAAELDSENWLHYARQAEILFTLGKEEEGEELCREALDHSALDTGSYFALAGVLCGRHPAKALSLLSPFEEEPLNPAQHLLLGNIHLLLEDYEKAQGCYHKVLEAEPNNHDALVKLAELRYKQGNPDALDYIQQALEKQPDDLDSLALKAKILTELSHPADLAGAIACLYKAVELAPRNRELREKLVTLLKKSRKLVKAFLEGKKLEKLDRELREEAEREAKAQEVTFHSDREEPDRGSEKGSTPVPPAPEGTE